MRPQIPATEPEGGMNTFVPLPYEQDTNSVLAAAARTYPNVVLANWNKTISDRTSLLWPDDIHPHYPAGTKVYAAIAVKLKNADPRSVDVLAALRNVLDRDPSIFVWITYAEVAAELNLAAPGAEDGLAMLGHAITGSSTARPSATATKAHSIPNRNRSRRRFFFASAWDS